jgi:hypothetical protein
MHASMEERGRRHGNDRFARWDAAQTTFRDVHGPKGGSPLNVRRRIVSFASIVLVAGSIIGSVAEGPNAAAASKLHVTRMTPSPASGGMCVAARTALRQGYLVADQALYERQKAQADARAGQGDAASAPAAALAPTTSRSWAGVYDTCCTPSDSTSAIGTTRFIENVNDGYAIYNRTSNTPLDVGSLADLWGASVFDSTFDPQIVWDPSTKRFYFTGDDVVSSTQNQLAFGFSKTASPSSAADWCQYAINYGSEFPDYPKLGMTKDFVVFGANVFNGNTFRGADILAVTKPVAGTSCPTPASFSVYQKKTVLNQNGTKAFTPVPAHQTDPSPTGYVVARPLSLPTTNVTVFKVSKNADGTANIQTTGSNVTVASYTVPPSASQKGTTFKIDTSDARPTQAVSSIDPSHTNSAGKPIVGLWTQQTIAGGGGSVVRWLEINPVTHTVVQSGTQANASRFVFNGAISPDRLVRGTTKAFGQNMVLTFNTSSSTTYTDVEVVSKRAGTAVSSPLVLKTSTGSDIDFACAGNGNVCRWGDYAAANPDPGASASGTTGAVWITQMWNVAGNTSGVAWRTWNAAVNP